MAILQTDIIFKLCTKIKSLFKFFFFFIETFHSWRGFICNNKKKKLTFWHSQKDLNNLWGSEASLK